MTLELLEKHGIREFAKAGYGDQLTQSRLEKADISVCMNDRVYDECAGLVTFPARPHIWSVADLGEPGRISDVESERQLYREEAYREIVRNVDRLISDILGEKHILSWRNLSRAVSMRRSMPDWKMSSRRRGGPATARAAARWG